MFITELCLFPNAETDDIVDTLTMAIIDLKTNEDGTYLGFAAV